MPKPEQGRIVLVEVPDPQNRNTKTRPAVIVSETGEITVDGAIFCVAVTSTLPQKLPDDYVLLPFHRGGRARTGLKKRCAAVCSWLFEIKEDQIKDYIGIVPANELNAILETIDDLD